MDFYYICIFIIQTILAFGVVTNITPYDTKNNTTHKFIVTLLWVSLALKNFYNI